jgi:hypothetical protein
MCDHVGSVLDLLFPVIWTPERKADLLFGIIISSKIFLHASPHNPPWGIDYSHTYDISNCFWVGCLHYWILSRAENPKGCIGGAV